MPVTVNVWKQPGEGAPHCCCIYIPAAKTRRMQYMRDSLPWDAAASSMLFAGTCRPKATWSPTKTRSPMLTPGTTYQVCLPFSRWLLAQQDPERDPSGAWACRAVDGRGWLTASRTHPIWDIIGGLVGEQAAVVVLHSVLLVVQVSVVERCAQLEHWVNAVGGQIKAYTGQAQLAG